MGRRVAAILFTLIIFLPCLFAGGANEGRAYYFPRNVVNNQNVMIELTQAKSLSTSTISADYENSSPDNLAIFRLRDSLRTKDQSVSGGVVVTISSNDGWCFVHENNPTSRRSFQLSGFCVERQSSSYGVDSFQKLANSTTLSRSGAKSYFKFNEGAQTYTMLMPYTDFYEGLFSFYANYIREFDVCVVIPDDNTTLEAGYYTTTLTITSTAYQECNSNGRKDGGAKTISETVTLRGYVGIDPTGNEGSYSFTVTSAADTYSMNLGITSQNTPYAVANTSFLYNHIDSSAASNGAGKFTIYISPTREYETSGTYRFIKIGSESQARTDINTIYYDLYLNTNNGYKSMGSLGSATLNGNIGSAGKLSNAVPTTYFVRPKFTPTKISDSGILGGSTQYLNTWELDQTIYLKLTSGSMAATHNPGMYYSYVYFTLVYN
ncbi:MAG: hypothetical protein IJ863_01880 [Spirochaetales bacterium]|nr:hypothetical protein [Spirochaetales bacterium]